MRSTLLRMLAIAVLALSVAVGPAPLACACSCKGLTTAEALASADAVFEGDVVAAGTPKGGSSAELVPYTITVSRVFKGAVPSLAVVRSEASEASCGIVLKGPVVVFATGGPDDLRTTLCSVPAPLDRAQLGAGTAPSPGRRPSEPTASAAAEGPVATHTGRSDTLPFALWTLVGLGAVAALVGWLARRR